MRYGGDIGDRQHLQTQGLYCPDGVLAPGARALHNHVDLLQAHRLGSFDRLLGGQARRERRAFARAFETGRTGAAPGYRIPLIVGYGNDGVIKGCCDMHLPGGQRALYFLYATLAARRSYILSHNTSLAFERLGVHKSISDRKPHRPRASPGRTAAGEEGAPIRQRERSAKAGNPKDYFFAPRRRPRPATVFFGPLRVRALVRVRCPRTGRLRRWRRPR